MSSRDAFLQRLRAAVPPALPLPAPYISRTPSAHLAARFRTTTEAVGGAVHTIAHIRELAAYLDGLAPARHRLVHPDLPAPGRPAPTHPHLLADLQLTVLPGVVAVAEDAAVLVTGLDALGPRMRAAGFLAQHVVLVVHAHTIVPDLNAAFALQAVQDALEHASFAVWVSGPSKTADIEQTLVHGAHGPEALTVVLVDPE